MRNPASGRFALSHNSRFGWRVTRMRIPACVGAADAPPRGSTSIRSRAVPPTARTDRSSSPRAAGRSSVRLAPAWKSRASVTISRLPSTWRSSVTRMPVSPSYACRASARPSGRIANVPPRSRSRMAQNSGSLSKRGTHSQSIAPLRPTSPAVASSPMRPWSSIARYPSRSSTVRNIKPSGPCAERASQPDRRSTMPPGWPLWPRRAAPHHRGTPARR